MVDVSTLHKKNPVDDSRSTYSHLRLLVQIVSVKSINFVYFFAQCDPQVTACYNIWCCHLSGNTATKCSKFSIIAVLLQ